MKVFESFAGYGSQSLSLVRLGVQHEVVGVSEIDADAIIAYGVLRYKLDDYTDDLPDKKQMKKELSDKGITTNNFSLEKLKQVYIYSKLINNYGDITRLNPAELPDIDYFTYSFPCQDISIIGTMDGLQGTKSSLLYECKKIIECKKPKYLLLENVKNLVGKKFRQDFDNWCDYLASLGYTTYFKVLNAKDYGIPQNRPRIFAISILGEHTPYIFPDPIPLKFKFGDVLDGSVDDSYFRNPKYLYYYLKCTDGGFDRHKRFLSSLKIKDIATCITTKPDHVASNFVTDDYGRKCIENKIIPDDIKIRILTPEECFRLMGLDDNEIEQIINAPISKTKLYMLSGNSIVIDVLNAIHSNLFKSSLL